MAATLVGVECGIERLPAALYTRLMINQTKWVSLARPTKRDLLKLCVNNCSREKGTAEKVEAIKNKRAHVGGREARRRFLLVK